MNKKLFKYGLISLTSFIILSFIIVLVVAVKEPYVFDTKIDLQIVEPGTTDDVPIVYFNLKVIDNAYSTSHIKHIELIDSEGNKFFAENQEYMLKEDYFGLYKNTTHSFTLDLTNHDIDKLIFNEAVLYYNDLRVQTIIPESFTVSVRNSSDSFSFKTAKYGNDQEFSIINESWVSNTDLKLIRVDNFDQTSNSILEINGMDYKQAVNKSFAKPSLINLEIKTPIKDFEKLAYSNFDSYATLVFENNQQEEVNLYINLDRSINSRKMTFSNLFKLIKLGDKQ